MNADSIPPRLIGAVGLLALAPVVWYGVELSQSAGVIAGVNVLLTIASLAVAMRPIRNAGHGNPSV
jgi:hypothetical protein